jgi:hypothetical protein
MSAPDRRRLVDRNNDKLSIRRQCALLGLARSGVYRPSQPANAKPVTAINPATLTIQRRSNLRQRARKAAFITD